jgi:hypothetical protein
MYVYKDLNMEIIKINIKKPYAFKAYFITKFYIYFIIYKIYNPIFTNKKRDYKLMQNLLLLNNDISFYIINYCFSFAFVCISLFISDAT